MMELKNKEWFMVWLPRSLKYVAVFILTIFSSLAGFLGLLFALTLDFPFSSKREGGQSNG